MAQHRESDLRRLALSAFLVMGLWICMIPLMAAGEECTVEHSPLHPKAMEATEVKAHCDHPGGWRTAIVYMIVGRMSDCTELQMSTGPWPCRERACLISKTVSINQYGSFKSPESRFAEGSLVTYWVEATALDNTVMSSAPITFAVGSPPLDSIAIPVWWNRSADPRSRINIVVMPDSSYEDHYDEFIKDAQQLIKGAFFDKGRADSLARWRSAFNLWLAPLGANVQEEPQLRLIFNVNVQAIAGSMQARMVLRRESEGTNWSQIALGGTSSIIGGQQDQDWIFIHESGHMLFGLADEYEINGGYSMNACRNVFDTANSCESYAKENGASDKVCQEIGSHSNRWHIQDGISRTMAARTPPPYNMSTKWGLTIEDCLEGRIKKCLSGICP